jgi:hypothetical protein
MKRAILPVVATVIMILLAASLMPGSDATAVLSARADGLGGVIVSNVYPPLLSGTTRYTTSQVTSLTANTASYGSVQIMLRNVVTGSQTITVTPQFSLQDVPCASVSQWFTATTYQYYQPYSIATSSTTLTETIGAWQATSIAEIFTVVGSNTAAREIGIQGQCMRVHLSFSNPGQAYTPTLVIRALNRN